MAMRRGFTIHHNGPPARCVGRDHSRCVAFWDAVRRFHTASEPDGRGWSDVAYSFGVCPHGTRFVGRGWDRGQWANGSDVVGAYDGRDSEWYTVLVFVGGDASTGDEEPPTADMVRATGELINEGRTSGRCSSQVLPHNAFKAKPCPGSAFTALAWLWHNAPIDLQEDDMTPAEVQAACASALRNMTRDIRGVGGSADADAIWARYVYDAARESLADVDVTPVAVADAVLARSSELATAVAEELGGSADVAVVEAAVENGLRRVFADAATPDPS